MPRLPSKIFNTQPEEDRQRSLFGEILDWMLAPLLLLWPMSIAITYLVAKSIANQPFDHALDDKILILSQQIKLAAKSTSATSRTSSLFTPLPASAQRILRADGLDSVFFQVTDAQHNLLDGDADFPFPDETSPIGVVKFRVATLRGNEIRVAYSTVNLSRGASGNTLLNTSPPMPRLALIQVGETLEKRSQLANEIIKGVILPQFIILPIALTLIWLALARGLSPLIEMQNRIRARDPDDLSPIISGHIPEEISPLVASFNEMLERLSLSIALQKRFIADAAHQMKTPLAGMRMQSELALRHTDPIEIHRSLIQLAKSSSSATHLVNQLLSLARAENSGKKSNSSDLRILDLSELVRSVTSEWVPSALNLRIDLGLEVPEHPVLIEGNALMLRELISNLIDNALHYTPAGKSVTLRVLLSALPVNAPAALAQHANATDAIPEPQRAILEVEDQGIGIRVEDRPHVFERFYRVLDNLVDGSGLGLAIVREIAAQHGADITLAAATDCSDPAYPGALFRLIFPLCEATIMANAGNLSAIDTPVITYFPPYSPPFFSLHTEIHSTVQPESTANVISTTTL